MAKPCLFFLQLVLLFVEIFCCENWTSCTECISDKNCAWCISFKGKDSAGCISRENASLCEENQLENPLSEVIDISPEIDENESKIDDRPYSIRPQNVRLSIRNGETKNITVKFGRNGIFKLDLYFLIDASQSILGHQTELKKLEQNLPDQVRDVTKDFRLGFGSFVEKNIMPFTSTDESGNSCTSPNDKSCSTAYVFKHHLSLSEETRHFSEEIVKVNQSGNIDFVEASLEALLQVMVCKEKLNWGENSLHLIVVITDDGFHVAGDGKLLGLIKPNDGLCHLDPEGHYTHDLVQDYPSLSQINRLAIDNRMWIIFAVPEKQIDFYESLKHTLRSSRAGILSNDSKNIGELVETIYREIRNSLILRTEEDVEYLDVKFFTKCKGNSYVETNNCTDISDETEFVVSVALKNCPKSLDKSQKRIRISPQGINQNFVIDLNLLCSCQCGKEIEEGSAVCGSQGDLSCGKCDCKPGFYGKNCQCDEKNKFKYEIMCRKEPSSEICELNGDCVCGECKCHERTPKITGRYCECTNDNCVDDCLGQGECHCGVCQCFQGFKGPNCNCTTSEDRCKSQLDGNKICSEHGICECGSCICDDNFSGEFCENSHVNEMEQICDDLLPCIEQKYLNKTLTNRASDESLELELECHFDELENYKNDVSYDCERNLEGCQVKYKYVKRDKIIICSTEQNCGPPVDMASMGIIGFFSTLAAGLLIIGIILGIKSYKDRIEYERFLLEKEGTKFADENNPLYKNPTTEFQNPLFNRTS